MKKNIINKIIVLAIIIFFMLLNNEIFAAGTFSLDKSSVTIKEGKTTTFSVIGTKATGRVDISSSNSSVATVSSSSEWLENSSSKVTITAKKAGTVTITVKGTVADEEGAEADVTKTIKVTVEAPKEETTDKKEDTTSSNKDTSSSDKGTSTTNKDNTTQEKPKEKSNNAYLSTLGVTPKEYDFSGFSKTKMSYNVTVPNDVNSLKVLYKTADSNAKVSVSGNSGFEVGSDNEIKVKVTAEDGKATKTYTIKVTKLAEEEEKPGNVIEDEEDLYLTSLSIEGIDISPEFAKDTYSYKATINQANLTQVKVNATASIADANIEVSGNNDLVIGENLINIVLTTEGTVEQKVYQIVLTIEKQEENVENEIVNSTDSNLIGNLKNYAIIAIVVVALIVIAIIVLICLLIRENKKINDDDYDYEEEIEDKKAKRVKKEEYNVYEDNQNVGRRRGKHSR